MEISLTSYEARVIGCLIEKEITTPEQYPLSLNALVSACNQKSNRDPVLELDDSTVQQTVDELVKKRLITDKSGFGSRVSKYKHRFCNSEFGVLQFSEQELGIICVLLLRGPQTPGELRTRTNRLCNFSDVHEVESTLKTLMERTDGPFVSRLPREPGRRESRYIHLFNQNMETPGLSADSEIGGESMTDHERLEELELVVSQLREEVEHLKHQIRHFTEQTGNNP